MQERELKINRPRAPIHGNRHKNELVVGPFAVWGIARHVEQNGVSLDQSCDSGWPMVVNTIRAFFHWKVGRHLLKTDPLAAANHFSRALDAQPSDERQARRVVERLLVAGNANAARQVVQKCLAFGDSLEYWRHFDSFLDELETSRQADADVQHGSYRIALFNDTDNRRNIGCRLTSKGLKGISQQAFPQSRTSSRGFKFSAYHNRFAGKIMAESPEPDALRSHLGERTTYGYGDGAVATIEQSDLVALQPEGSIDDNTDIDGLKTFFSPILLAALLGKPTVILNGTVPRFHDERGRFLNEMFATLPAVAARDALSAEAYAIKFIPDAALLYEPAMTGGERTGCLITTGARNTAAEDHEIFRKALEVCDITGLRPIVLTHASDRFSTFEKDIRDRSGRIRRHRKPPHGRRNHFKMPASYRGTLPRRHILPL